MPLRHAHPDTLTTAQPTATTPNHQPTTATTTEKATTHTPHASAGSPSPRGAFIVLFLGALTASLWLEPAHHNSLWLALPGPIVLSLLHAVQHELPHHICHLIARYTSPRHQRLLHSCALFSTTFLLFVLHHTAQHYLP